MTHFFKVVLISLICIAPGLAFAAPIIRSGDSVSVDDNQVLEGDFYGFGSTIVISGEADNDVYLAGGSVTVNAPIKQDLVILGGSVNIHGPVDDDVRVAGGEVTIADHVEGDVVVLGGTLNLLSTASVGGDVLFMGSKVDISGSVAGSVVGRGGQVRIDNSVGGNVSVQASQSFSLGDRAEILGNVEYESMGELARAQGAVVVGDIQKKILPTAGVNSYALLIPLLILLFSVFTAYLIFRSPMQQVVDATAQSYGIQGLVGLGILLVMPFVGFLLVTSVLGMIVGIVIFIAYVLLIFTTWILSGVVLGTLILKYAAKKPKITLASVTLGVIIFDVLFLVPFIGPFLVFAVFVIVLGGVGTQLYHLIR